MQNKVVLKHSRIEINNYDLGDCPRLEYCFSVYDKVRHTSFLKIIEYDSENHKLIIPRGVDIGYLERLFCCNATVDRQCDPYVNSDPIRIRYLSKDERQLEILKFLIGADNYSYTKTKSQLSVNSATGSGKTFVTIGTMCFTGARMILITSSLDWLNQWKAKLLEYTPLSEKQMFTVAGSGSISKLYCRNPLDYQVFLVSHSTIKSYGDSKGWDKVEDFFRYLQCSLKVFDEAHLYFDNMARIDLHSNVKKTIYLTATPERSNEDENNIYQLYFKNIPSIVLFNEETDPHVNYIALHYNSHPSPMDINNCKNAYGFDRNKYVTYVTKRPLFLDLVVVLIDMVLYMNGKILIYIGTNHGIMQVYNYIVEVFPFLERYIGIYTSMSDKTNKEQNLFKKIILSTTKSCGAASDIADLAVTINLAEPFKSSVLAKQTLGRCRANDTLYIDAVDNGFYFTKKYYETKKPIFAQYAKSCKDVHMTEFELQERAEKIREKYMQKKVMCMPIFKK